MSGSDMRDLSLEILEAMGRPCSSDCIARVILRQCRSPQGRVSVVRFLELLLNQLLCQGPLVGVVDSPADVMATLISAIKGMEASTLSSFLPLWFDCIKGHALLLPPPTPTPPPKHCLIVPPPRSHYPLATFMRAMIKGIVQRPDGREWHTAIKRTLVLAIKRRRSGQPKKRVRKKKPAIRVTSQWQRRRRPVWVARRPPRRPASDHEKEDGEDDRHARRARWEAMSVDSRMKWLSRVAEQAKLHCIRMDRLQQREAERRERHGMQLLRMLMQPPPPPTCPPPPPPLYPPYVQPSMMQPRPFMHPHQPYQPYQPPPLPCMPPRQFGQLTPSTMYPGRSPMMMWAAIGASRRHFSQEPPMRAPQPVHRESSLGVRVWRVRTIAVQTDGDWEEEKDDEKPAEKPTPAADEGGETVTNEETGEAAPVVLAKKPAVEAKVSDKTISPFPGSAEHNSPEQSHPPTPVTKSPSRPLEPSPNKNAKVKDDTKEGAAHLPCVPMVPVPASAVCLPVSVHMPPFKSIPEGIEEGDEERESVVTEEQEKTPRFGTDDENSDQQQSPKASPPNTEETNTAEDGDRQQQQQQYQQQPGEDQEQGPYLLSDTWQSSLASPSPQYRKKQLGRASSDMSWLSIGPPPGFEDVIPSPPPRRPPILDAEEGALSPVVGRREGGRVPYGSSYFKEGTESVTGSPSVSSAAGVASGSMGGGGGGGAISSGVGGAGDADVWQNRAKKRTFQVVLVKKTEGYRNYVRLVPKHRRGPFDPKTPDAAARVSNKQFNDQLSFWRQALHMYDAPMKNHPFPHHLALEHSHHHSHPPPRPAIITPSETLKAMRANIKANTNKPATVWRPIREGAASGTSGEGGGSHDNNGSIATGDIVNSERGSPLYGYPTLSNYKAAPMQLPQPPFPLLTASVDTTNDTDAAGQQGGTEGAGTSSSLPGRGGKEGATLREKERSC
ncbi:unnamed protein product [Vitrella brassicaformis CCMP3155]|uniref:Histone RNA hairpin-binding protein RNA-binding domain-containing protein n=1 Tax=Vitrella brassicaformis (strain CCMP3155) TaxID=1169540 RepID=A0A0G4GWJ5_VITBC|nr:unnamed protein product [Vitrella brassicaformis CCMP3155]|eukprot:CEM35378.1 unnamed protein product [Vitrella brassicaformis CCMP3155]